LFAAAAALVVAAGPAPAAETITVWWGKGFYKSEDDALIAAIKKFEDKTGIKVELSQYAIQDMIPKTVAALDSGTVPDVAYSDTYDVQAQGKWAYEGKLEDLSDILLPMKDKFAPNTLETALLYNNVTKKKAYYGLEGSPGEGRLQGKRYPDRLERLLVVLVRQGAAGDPQGDREPHLWRRPANGRGIHRLLPVVLHLHGRL
jgi:hypothetical protein